MILNSRAHIQGGRNASPGDDMLVLSSLQFNPGRQVQRSQKIGDTFSTLPHVNVRNEVWTDREGSSLRKAQVVDIVVRVFPHLPSIIHVFQPGKADLGLSFGRRNNGEAQDISWDSSVVPGSEITQVN